MEDIVGKRALIVDDEIPARLRLRELLERSPLVVLSGECASGAEAVAAIRDLQPELLFLDVQMPLMDGFQVLRQIPNDRMPVTIFVTAYDRFALAAFEAHALDYLLKPFSDERFAKTLDRAIAQIDMRQNGEIASLDFSSNLPVERRGECQMSDNKGVSHGEVLMEENTLCCGHSRRAKSLGLLRLLGPTR